MAFRDIKGQDRAVDLFCNSVTKDRLAHAYLFLGPQGLGKSLLAQNLAKLLNCARPIKQTDVSIDCCDNCISCRKIDNLNHPDIHWLKTGEGSRKISIDEIRALQKEISLKPYEGRFKVFIILEAQNMTREAASSLLKTLEEPPSFSLIILTSADIQGLLPTIISRCQLIRFYPLDCEKLKEILAVDYKLPLDYGQFLSAQAEGRIGQALALSSKEALNTKNRIIDQVAQDRRGLSNTELFELKDKKSLATQIRYLLHWYRDIFIFKAGLPISYIMNADRIEMIKSQASAYAFEDLEGMMVKILQTHALIEQNVSPKISLKSMLLELSHSPAKLNH